MVLENQEIVMEKSWKNILSILWEPWYVQTNVKRKRLKWVCQPM